MPTYASPELELLVLLYLALFVGAGDPQSGPHAYVENTAEPPS